MNTKQQAYLRELFELYYTDKGQELEVFLFFKNIFTFRDNDRERGNGLFNSF